MGRQGGIARFTGTVGDLTYYFDDDKGKVKWKSRLNRKKWLARREMWRQHNSSRLFGAAAVVASNLWRGMPAGIRRLADGSGYGRLVGRCASLMGDDGQLWDADLLKGLELNAEALTPAVRFGVRNSVSGNSLSLGSGPECEAGTAVPYRLEGLDRLAAELDLAAGDSAGAKPATFLVAHGLSKRFGFGMNGMRLTAEEARVKTAFRQLGAGDQGLDSLRLSSGPECEEVFQGKTEASGRVGMRPEAAASNTGNTGAKRAAQRRYRVWVYGVKVADTLWNEAQETFTLDAWKGVGGCGYVTDWEEDFRSVVDLRNPFEGEKMRWDGEYVVYCALEVSEKRGRHWVRLPYCCRFRVVDVVLIEDGELSTIVEGEEGSEVVDLTSATIDSLVLIEFKGVGRACPAPTCVPYLNWAGDSGVACANSGQGPPFARSLISKEFAIAEAIRAGL